MGPVPSFIIVVSCIPGDRAKLRSRGNHVGALVLHHQPEVLAQQLLAAHEHNTELQEQLVSTGRTLT